MTTLGVQQRLRGGGRPREENRDVLGNPVPLAPDWWRAIGGSEPEYYVYRALIRRGLTEGSDFTYQSKQAGGRTQLGGAIVDFLLVFPPIGINVQSLYWHTTEAQQRSHDQTVQSLIEGFGIQLYYISEFQAINSPDTAVADAIAGKGSIDPIGL
jgi:hypothetical protein|tara:strand:+ start:365 stop:829 length:465 start_codon:yes stop_codon:yes gene_type:complete